MRVAVPILFLIAVVVGVGWLLLFAGPDLDSRGITVETDAGAPAAFVGVGEAASAVMRRTVANAGEATGAAPDSGITAMLVGTVRDAAGRPIANAAVAASRCAVDGFGFLDRGSLPRREEFARTESGADGRYQLQLPKARPFVVEVAAAGFANLQRAGCQGGETVDFVLEPPASLRCRVVRAGDGSPVASAVVRVVRAGALFSRQRLGEGATDARGEVLLEGLTPGAVRVAVVPLRDASPREIDLELPAGAVREHTVAVTSGKTVSGVVVAADSGRPVPGARVRGAAREVVTLADGCFELPGFVRRDHVDVQVAAAGYATVSQSVVGGTDDGILPEIEVRLQPGRRVCGRIVDPSGVPSGGVYVAAAGADSSQRWTRVDWCATATGDDGRFAIDGIAPGLQHTLVVRRDGFATLLYDLPEAAQWPRECDVGTIALRLGGGLAGVLVDEHQQPVAGHEVTLLGANADRFRARPRGEDADRSIDSYVAERVARTDDQGRFAFDDVAGGEHRVMARRFESHGSVVVSVALRDGERVGGVRLELFRGQELRGRVAAEDGGAVPKTYLSIDPQDGQATSADVEVGPNGTFVARGLAAGRYVVSVYPYATDADRVRGRTFRTTVMREVLAGRTDVAIDVGVLLAVAGVVLDVGGRPVVGAVVSAGTSEERFSSSTTGLDGRFGLQLPPGRAVRVEVLAPKGGRVLCVTEAVAGSAELVLQAR